MKITPDQIEVNRFCVFDDNSVLLDFDQLNVSYLKVISSEMVAQCARFSPFGLPPKMTR